jgi:hypothetical protein
VRGYGNQFNLTRYANEHAADAPAGLASDAHSRRISLDLAEWHERLARLAELREAQLDHRF